LKKIIQSILFLIGPALLLLVPPLANSEDLVLIVNDSIGNITSITKKEVKRIYLGKKTTLNGEKIKPFHLMDKHPARIKFINETIRMRSVKLKAYWIKEMLKGGAHPPKVKKNYESLISSVKQERGGIGYLSLDVAVKSGLKIVKID
jgi:ABC-type phosphate transport system substrate-binding protein